MPFPANASSLSQVEHIAYRAHRSHRMSGTCGTQGPAQPPDPDIDRAFINRWLLFAQPSDQFRPSHGAIGVFCQKPQQPEFIGPQINRLSCPARLKRRHINRQVAPLEFSSCHSRASIGLQGKHPVKYHRTIHRPDNVIVSTGPKRPAPIFGNIVFQDDRNMGILSARISPQASAHFQA